MSKLSEEEISQKILSLLQTEKLSVHEMMKKLNLNKNQIMPSIRKLDSSGQIKYFGGGKWMS